MSQGNPKPAPNKLQAVVIGSGFGGAISCCRLAQKWGNGVLLLERGKRYPMGSFPRSPHQMADNFWSTPSDKVRRPKHVRGRALSGLYDVRGYAKMDAVVSAGLGGGSLIYANVFLEPPEQVFGPAWPEGVGKGLLQPYYNVAREVLGARPVPPHDPGNPRRRIIRTELFQAFAAEQGRQSRLADICVFFGTAYGEHAGAPTEIGLQELNRYGAVQTSCTYCAECDVGCNTHSKNSVDLNYLHVAEHVHGARIQTESPVSRMVPLAKNGEPDPAADGAYGYRVYYRQLGDDQEKSVDTQRVVVAAGTLGTNELLLRCRDEYRTLPAISRQLGQRFSGNGDFLSFVAEGERKADPNYGPVITQYTDFNLFHAYKPERAFLLEDASYPAFLAWLIEGMRPVINPLGVLKKLWRAIKWIARYVYQRFWLGKWSGSVADLFHEILKGDLSYRSSVLLCMGVDQGDGVLSLKNGSLDIDWPQQKSMPLYQAILACGNRFRRFVRSRFFTPLPTWKWPLRSNITVHPLGGCALAVDPQRGVVSAGAKRGQVFGYQGLYVADGSVLPGAVGANPVATIAAVSEWIAEGITGIAPDAHLGMGHPARDAAGING